MDSLVPSFRPSDISSAPAVVAEPLDHEGRPTRERPPPAAKRRRPVPPDEAMAIRPQHELSEQAAGHRRPARSRPAATKSSALITAAISAGGEPREEEEPAPKRLKQTASEFVGVCLRKADRRWLARIRHNGKRQFLGGFGGEREAARAFDTAARRLRGDDAHGGRATNNSRPWRLNFPTKAEVQRAKTRGALLTAEDKAAAAVASERQGPSEFVGVSWNKKRRKWQAQIKHGGEHQFLGGFDDEREAARAVDTAARRLRGDDAHGGRPENGGNWWRLNFPTKRQAGRAKALGMSAR